MVLIATLNWSVSTKNLAEYIYSSNFVTREEGSATKYHIVWCVKYRRKVLTDVIQSRLKEILNKIATDNKFRILEINGEEDHIHLLIECSPKHFIPNIMKALKGVSGRLLMQEFGEELKSKLWGGHLWNQSYFIATVSENTESQIKTYIQNQKN